MFDDEKFRLSFLLSLHIAHNHVYVSHVVRKQTLFLDDFGSTLNIAMLPSYHRQGALSACSKSTRVMFLVLTVVH